MLGSSLVRRRFPLPWSVEEYNDAYPSWADAETVIGALEDAEDYKAFEASRWSLPVVAETED